MLGLQGGNFAMENKTSFPHQANLNSSPPAWNYGNGGVFLLLLVCMCLFSPPNLVHGDLWLSYYFPPSFRDRERWETNNCRPWQISEPLVRRLDVEGECCIPAHLSLNNSFGIAVCVSCLLFFWKETLQFDDDKKLDYTIYHLIERGTILSSHLKVLFKVISFFGFLAWQFLCQIVA